MKKIYLIVLMTTITFSAFAADNVKNMFVNGQSNAELRMFSFSRNFDNSSKDTNDNSFGGIFGYKTDSLYGLSFGVTFLSSNNIESDDDKKVYGLLKSSQKGKHESYTKLGEYYIKGDWFDTKIKYGAQEISTPFLNKHDIRMTPYTYKGLGVVNNSVKGLTLSAYYITDFQGHTDTHFKSIGESFNASVNEDKGLFIFGAKYTLPKSVIDTLSVQAWNYSMSDVLVYNYLRADFAKKYSDITYTLRVSGVKMDDSGESKGGKFDTYQYGFDAGIAAYGAHLKGAYAVTGDDIIMDKWGHDKIIAQQVWTAGARGDEKAYLVQAGYDFSQIGLKGLSTYANYGVYKPEGDKKSLPDIHETNLNIQYSFSGDLEGLSLRARYAKTDFDAANQDFDDLRFQATYKFAFGGKK